MEYPFTARLEVSNLSEQEKKLGIFSPLAGWQKQIVGAGVGVYRTAEGERRRISGRRRQIYRSREETPSHNKEEVKNRGEGGNKIEEKKEEIETEEKKVTGTGLISDATSSSEGDKGEIGEDELRLLVGVGCHAFVRGCLNRRSEAERERGRRCETMNSTVPPRRSGGLLEGLYRVIMRRNSVYVTFVVAGVGERVRTSLFLSCSFSL
ncbi:hypothetical protein ACLOJK_005823 [Asimina triloba]